jgi:hypothetical protein
MSGFEVNIPLQAATTEFLVPVRDKKFHETRCRGIKKEPPEGGSKVVHREASNRVDRSHSRPKAGQFDNAAETLISG